MVVPVLNTGVPAERHSPKHGYRTDTGTAWVREVFVLLKTGSNLDHQTQVLVKWEMKMPFLF